MPAFTHRAARRGQRGVLRPWRRRHGGRQQEQREDHRRGRRAATRRATSSTIRTSPARRRSRICASGREPIHAPYLIHAGRLRRLPPVPVPRAPGRAAAGRAGRDGAAERALWPRTRCGTICRARCSSASSTEAAAVRHRRVARGAEVGLRGRTNTVLQTCFFAISGVLPREQAIAQIKQAIRKTYGGKGEARGAGELRARSTTRWRGCSRSRSRPRVTSRRDRPPLVPAHAPAFVRDVTAAMLAGRATRSRSA